LKQILEYLEVSDCNMEEGSLRCDANVSVRPLGDGKFGTKTEVKNLNSFRYLARALEFEIERQIATIEQGGHVTQETRLWNVTAGRTEPMRSKEHAHDYRYFPSRICCRWKFARPGRRKSALRCPNCPLRAARASSKPTD